MDKQKPIEGDTAQSLRVLIVEDSPRDVELVMREIRRGYPDLTWKRVETAEEMRTALGAEAWDLVVSDFKLPHFDGLAALAVLQETDFDLPFIIVSGVIGEETAVAAMRAGAHDYVMKDKLARLSSAITRELGDAQVRQNGKQMVEALLESEIRYRSIFDNSMLGISQVLPDGRLICVNQAYATMYGYANPAEMLSEAPDISRRYANLDDHLEVLRILNEHGAMAPREFSVVRRNGSQFVVLVAAREIRDAAGTLLYSQAEHIDITDRLQAEESLRRNQAMLARTESIAHIGSWEWEVATDTVTWSDELFRIFMRNPAEGAPSFLEHPNFYFPEDMQRLSEAVEVTLSHGTPYMMELHAIRQDGATRVCLARGQAEMLPGERATRLFGSLQDITEHKQEEAQRLVLEEQLRQQQRLESVGQLAAGLAHDFNNLLTGIIGFTRFVYEALPAEAASREDLAEVLALAGRAVALIRQLLAFSRKQVLQPVPVDLNQLVSDIAKMLGRLIGEHIDMRCHPAADLGVVLVDPGQIEQVLVNLAVNARDAMPEGGKLTIETANIAVDEEYARVHAGMLPGSYVMLTVSDNGCGIESSVLESIFEPFFTTKGVGKGTGLGLSTVYGIVKQHGGHILVTSELGSGTTFKVYLPCVAETIIEQAVIQPRELSRGMAIILIVEDEDVVRKVATRILAQQGYRVLTAALPSQADEILAAQGDDIALLLTDVVMPERSGRQLYESIHARYPHLRVLYMSGYTDDVIMYQSVLDTGAAFIQKPFTADALLRKVSAVLDGKP